MKIVIQFLIFFIIHTLIGQKIDTTPSKQYIKFSIEYCFKNINKHMNNTGPFTKHLVIWSQDAQKIYGIEQHNTHEFSWYQKHVWRPNRLSISTLKIKKDSTVILTKYEGFLTNIGGRAIIFPYLEPEKKVKKISTLKEILFWEKITNEYLSTIRVLQSRRKLVKN